MVINSGGPGAESRRLAQESEAALQRARNAADPAERDRQLAEAVAKAGDSELAAAYTYLQRAVGIIAVLLPPSLVLGNWLFGGKLLGSISAYYYTHMGNAFVGSLWALAVFFLSYNYRPLQSFELDNTLGRVASVAAVGVAVFPTARDAASVSGGERLVSVLHLVCAAVLFGLLGIFSHFLFTKTKDPASMTPEKRRRNRLYRICGKVIFASIALVLVNNALKLPASWHLLLVLETVCVLSFGTSWLVKGGFLGILADKTPPAP